MSKADKKLAMWNKDTDLVLRDLVLRQGEVDWAKIASTIEWDTGTVSAKECQGRWVYSLFLFCPVPATLRVQPVVQKYRQYSSTAMVFGRFRTTVLFCSC